MRYQCIRAEKANHDVRRLCDFLSVSPSGYYAWCSRPKSRRAVEDEALTEDIKLVFNEHKGRYGSPRVKREL